jgi:hypothetical protein
MISPAKVLGAWIPHWVELIRTQGVRGWIDATQAGRMGDELAPPALEWWSAMMAGSAPPEVLLVYLDLLSRFSLDEAELRAIACPVQFLAPAQAAPGDGSFDQRRPRAETEAWRAWVPDRRVAEIQSASYHLSATRPDACAIATRDFFLSIIEAEGQP